MTTRRRRWKTWIGYPLAAVLIPLALIGAYLGYLQLVGNFHTVIPGELYRSGQLSGEGFTAHIKRYGIRTIVNLRGANPGSPWYDHEVAAARKAGIEHVDFGMSAGEILTKARADQLVALLRKVPKPVLIHCQGGADRTGLAVALYLAEIKHASEARSEGAISLLYGHIGIPWLSASYPMDESWDRLEPLLGFNGS